MTQSSQPEGETTVLSEGFVPHFFFLVFCLIESKGYAVVDILITQWSCFLCLQTGGSIAAGDILIYYDFGFISAVSVPGCMHRLQSQL